MFERFEPEKMKKHKSTYYLVGTELYNHLRDAHTPPMWIEKALENAKNKRESDFLAEQLRSKWNN